MDTGYFEPFADLVWTVPCGSRGLPIALTTYHRRDLAACFAPRETWPSRDVPNPPRPRRPSQPTQGRAKPQSFARGPLSYVRRGREVLRSPDLLAIPRRLTRWLAAYLWSWAPLWHPPPFQYRLHHWWADSS